MKTQFTYLVEDGTVPSDSETTSYAPAAFYPINTVYEPSTSDPVYIRKGDTYSKLLGLPTDAAGREKYWKEMQERRAKNLHGAAALQVGTNYSPEVLEKASKIETFNDPMSDALGQAGWLNRHRSGEQKVKLNIAYPEMYYTWRNLEQGKLDKHDFGSDVLAHELSHLDTDVGEEVDKMAGKSHDGDIMSPIERAAYGVGTKAQIFSVTGKTIGPNSTDEEIDAALEARERAEKQGRITPLHQEYKDFYKTPQGRESLRIARKENTPVPGQATAPTAVAESYKTLPQALA